MFQPRVRRIGTIVAATLCTVVGATVEAGQRPRQEWRPTQQTALEAVEKASGNELITAVATEFKATKGETAKPAGLKAEELKNRSLETSRQVAALLDQKSNPEEATAFKQWLMETAKHVAAAAKEGGFMGMGGTAVTEAETAALKEVAEALGVAA